MTKQKVYRLPEETVKKIKEVQEKQGFKYEVDAVVHIVNDYMERDMIYKNIISMLNSLHFGVETAARNSCELKDIINSMCYKIYDSDKGIFMAAVGELRHQLTIDADERWEEEISNEKQKKDNAKAGRGE